jgi:hypothetical protein
MTLPHLFVVATPASFTVGTTVLPSLAPPRVVPLGGFIVLA